MNQPLVPPGGRLGAIEKLAKEDPRRARTGQVLDARIAAKRSELRKGSKKAMAKAAAAAGGNVDGGDEEENEAAPSASAGGDAEAAAGDDAMEEDGDAGDTEDGGGKGAGKEEGGGDDDDDDSDGTDDEDDDEEAQEGLEEDNLREMLAGGRGKVRARFCGMQQGGNPSPWLFVAVQVFTPCCITLTSRPTYGRNLLGESNPRAVVPLVFRYNR